MAIWKPLGTPQANKSHFLYNQLSLLTCPESENVHNLLVPGEVGKKNSTSPSSATIPYLGKCMKSTSGVAGGVSFANRGVGASGSSTWTFLVCMVADAIGTSSAICANSSGGNGTSLRISTTSGELGLFRTGVTSIVTSGLGLVSGVPYCIAASSDSVTGSVVIAVRLDSGYTTRSAQAAIASTSGDGVAVVGGANFAGGSLSFAGKIGLCAMGPFFTRAAILEEFAHDPWALVSPDGYRRNYFTNSVAAAAASTARGYKFNQAVNRASTY